MSSPGRRPWLSIVLPCWNDGAAVAQRILSIRGGGPLGAAVEFVVADASNREPSFPKSDRPSEVRWLDGLPPGRGGQLREGAKSAAGEVFLFHHADNELREEHLASLRRILEDPEVQAGAYHRNFAANWPSLAGLEPMARWWGRRWGFLYGDQSVWVRRRFYERLGGIKVLPLMEDVEFSDRLRSMIRPVLLDPPLEASMRRFQAKGRLHNKLSNLKLIALYRMGVSPRKLYDIYYG